MEIANDIANELLLLFGIGCILLAIKLMIEDYQEQRRRKRIKEILRKGTH